MNFMLNQYGDHDRRSHVGTIPDWKQDTAADCMFLLNEHAPSGRRPACLLHGNVDRYHAESLPADPNMRVVRTCGASAAMPRTHGPSAKIPGGAPQATVASSMLAWAPTVIRSPFRKAPLPLVAVNSSSRKGS